MSNPSDTQWTVIFDGDLTKEIRSASYPYPVLVWQSYDEAVDIAKEHGGAAQPTQSTANSVHYPLSNNEEATS